MEPNREELRNFITAWEDLNIAEVNAKPRMNRRSDDERDQVRRVMNWLREKAS